MSGGGGAVVAWGDPLLTGSTDGSFALPTGTVAFLLTDIEGSTRAWGADGDAMAAAMERHNAILDAAVSAHGGVCPPAQGEGDSIVAAFSRPSDAVLAARDAQRALAAEPWPTAEPLGVRMAVHAGEARTLEDGNYAGQAIIRAARLRAIAHGGQVVVSSAARDLTIDHLGTDVSFLDLGEHRLRDLARPERVWQLVADGIPEAFPPVRSLDAHPNNLPAYLSTFVGREAEIVKVSELLTTNRLVTIAGAGGAGKTRLAGQVAAAAVDRHEDGAWWVELAPLADPALLPAAVSTAVGVRGEVDDDAVASLADRLGDRSLLLVLDNCEHLVAAVAGLVETLLRRCPRLTILCTSREPLDVPGEIAWRIPPLATPRELVATPIDALGQFESVRLFLERARAVRPNFHLTDDNGPVVAAICERLDGIPLAIELAAARCRLLSPAQILDGLADAIDLLTGGGRTVLPRQQTLEASIGWSHELLGDDERVLLRRLSTFAGGVTLDDAEAVVADDALPAPTVLDVLDRLVAQSLVLADEDDAGPQRYRLLETVRQYAARQLVDAGEAVAVAAAHARHYLTVARQIGCAVEGPDDLPGYARAVAERSNLARALETFAAGGPTRWTDRAELLLADAWARVVTDPGGLLRDLNEALDDAPSGSPLVGALLAARANAAGLGALSAAGFPDAEEALRLGVAAQDDRTVARAASALAWNRLYGAAGDLVGFEEAIELARRAGDPFIECYALAGWSGFALVGLGPDQQAWEAHAHAERAVHALGNAYLELQCDVQAAWGACLQARYADALASVTRARRRLEELAGSARLHADYLRRSCFAGNGLAIAEFWLGAVGELPLDLDRSATLVERARAEGGVYLPVMLGSFVCAALGIADPRWAIEEIRGLEQLAEEVGSTNILVLAENTRLGFQLLAGEVAQAREDLAAREEKVVATRSSISLTSHHLLRAEADLAVGELGDAEERVHDGLELGHRYGFRSEVVDALELLAAVLIEGGARAEGTRLAGAAAGERYRSGERLLPLRIGDQRRGKAALDRAREELGADEYDTAWGFGAALALDDAVELARRSRGRRGRPSFGWSGLTPTEAKVVEHAAAGLTNPEIGGRLLMGRATVKTHLSRAFAKLGVRNRSELAAAYAARTAGEVR